MQNIWDKTDRVTISRPQQNKIQEKLREEGRIISIIAQAPFRQRAVGFVSEMSNPMLNKARSHTAFVVKRCANAASRQPLGISWGIRLTVGTR